MKKVITAIIILLIIGLGWYFRADLLDFYARLAKNLPSVENVALDDLINKIQQTISAPPPLRLTEQAPESILTKAGVLKWTNSQRAANGGLLALTENAKLDAAALAKAAAGDAAANCARTSVQVHGALGQTWEHDSHLYVRRAWQGAAMLGDSRALYYEVARRFAGGAA